MHCLSSLQNDYPMARSLDLLFTNTDSSFDHSHHRREDHCLQYFEQEAADLHMRLKYCFRPAPSPLTLRVIISLVADCVKTNPSTWLYLFGYFISFIPAVLIFVVFVLPSPLYKAEFSRSANNVLRRRVFRMNAFRVKNNRRQER